MERFLPRCLSSLMHTENVTLEIRGQSELLEINESSLHRVLEKTGGDTNTTADDDRGLSSTNTKKKTSPSSMHTSEKSVMVFSLVNTSLLVYGPKGGIQIRINHTHTRLHFTGNMQTVWPEAAARYRGGHHGYLCLQLFLYKLNRNII